MGNNRVDSVLKLDLICYIYIDTMISTWKIHCTFLLLVDMNIEIRAWIYSLNRCVVRLCEF